MDVKADVKVLEKLCKKPNNLRLLILIEGEVKQDDIYRKGIAAGAFYGALKDLASMGLIERVKRDVYYLRLTEKGKKVRELILQLIGELSKNV